MRAKLSRVLYIIFPVERRERSKVLLLFSVAILIGIGYSVSRAAAEALFLTRLGVAFLPYLQLVNPLLVFVATTVYGVFSTRLSHGRLLIYTALIPIPLIVLARVLIDFDLQAVYFALFAFVLAYATVIAVSWAVYLPSLYDIQQAKRLVPIIAGGNLIGTTAGGGAVAFVIPVIGAANGLMIWIAALLSVVALVRIIDRHFTPLHSEARKAPPTRQQRSVKPPGFLSYLKEGIVYARSSALFRITVVTYLAMASALQLIDFEYSKIFARAFPNSSELAAFLGLIDSLPSIIALLVQGLVVPQAIRRLGLQTTNLFFPLALTTASGGLVAAPLLGPAIFARFTRTGLNSSLRGTTGALILNAVPAKSAPLVRSFCTGVALPMGQLIGALLLVVLQWLALPIAVPITACILCGLYIFYTTKQNTAYSEALLDLLKEDKIHLLGLDDEGLQQLDATAVAMIRQRLNGGATIEAQVSAGTGRERDDMTPKDTVSQSGEECLAAIELLRAIGSSEAFEALREALPCASPDLTASALQALAAIDSSRAAAVVTSYLDDPDPQIRLAAVDGLGQRSDENVQRQLERHLSDPEVEVRAGAIRVLLSGGTSPLSARAESIWQAMLEDDDRETQIAALSVFDRVPEPVLAEHVYRLLDHADGDLYHAALRALYHLAEAGYIQEVDDRMIQALEQDDAESRELAVKILAAIRTDAALETLLRQLDDEHPMVREALIQGLRTFGKKVLEPLLSDLHSPQTSLVAKVCALSALAPMEGVHTDQLQPFWEGELRHLYHYKLMLTYLETHASDDRDAFLKVALRDAYERTLALLLHLLAVWTSPDVARLVESGLRDPQRQKRAQALEALESLSERRFTRLFLPILDAETEDTDVWKHVANQQWHFDIADLSEVLEACLESHRQWLVVGAILSAQARGMAHDNVVSQSLEQAMAAAADHVRHIARRALILASETPIASLPGVLLSLKGIPLFGPMNLDQLYTIAAHLERCDAPTEHVIFQEGEPSYDLYIIVSGEVAIIQRRRGVPHTLVTLDAGQFFGDMAIFERRSRSASAVAVGPTTLLKLSAEDFRQVVLLEPAIAFVIFRVLSERLNRFEQEAAAA